MLVSTHFEYAYTKMYKYEAKRESSANIANIKQDFKKKHEHEKTC